MIPAFRLLAFLASAIGVELARGAGFATLALAGIAGVLRLHPLSVLAAAGAGAALSLALPEDAGSGGKVVHSLSNAPFVVLLHSFLGMAAYAVARILRRLARSRTV